MENVKDQDQKVIQKKKKGKGCLWVVIAIFAIGFIGVIFGGGNDKVQSENLAQDTIVQGTGQDVVLSQEQLDSIDKAKAAEIAKLAPLFIESTDEFKGITWVKPKSAPKYRNQNGVYMYFAINNGVASNLRLVMQYEGSDWLFIKHVIFLVNGSKYEYDINFERDNDSRVWEWADVSAKDSYLPLALEVAEEVKIRYEGSQYNKDVTLTQKQIQSIKDTIKYYQLLGGSIL